jgi:BolA family transcriptional regulator, general stress-responsive regulator
MTLTEEIVERLGAAFRFETLEVHDESEGHRGHAGWRDGGETHFRVRISAPELSALSRLERHRAIHTAIGPDLIGRLHALAIEVT